MALINKLLAQGELPADKYKHITVREIEVHHQLSYFNYFIENQEIFEHVHELALDLFKQDGLLVGSRRRVQRSDPRVSRSPRDDSIAEFTPAT